VDISNLIQTVLIYALPVIFAITVHEAAHGYVARHFGDNTAEVMGRVTLNPMKHIDPIGTILMPLMLYFATSGAFLFGYALTIRPVLRSGVPLRTAVHVALAADTASITVMEIIDNVIIVAVPGAMDAGLRNPLFWGSLAISLATAFAATVPVNRWLIGRGRGHAVAHAYHH
jgi:Zn-dependent protease